MKRILILSSLFIVSLTQWAQSVPKEQAVEIALKFFQNLSSQDVKARKAQGVIQPAYSPLDVIPSSELINDSIINNIGGEAFYLISNDRYTVVVGADKKTKKVLGYSDNNNIVNNDINPSMKELLNCYAKDLAYAKQEDTQESSLQETCTFLSSLPLVDGGVEKLLQTEWGQTGVFMELCPNKYPTGCVATAMAQVMNYWKWPQEGKGYNTYKSEYLEDSVSATFEGTKYDWNNMCNSYNTLVYPDLNITQKQKDAVSTLMFHCGASVNMEYSQWESNADIGRIPKAMVDHFGYGKNIHLACIKNHTEQYWHKLMIEELNAGRPIIYVGLNGAHCFVIDGYKVLDDSVDEPYYHVNWGWGGDKDGYYLLSALNSRHEPIVDREQYMVFGVRVDEDLSSPPFFSAYSMRVTPESFTQGESVVVGVAAGIEDFARREDKRVVQIYFVSDKDGKEYILKTLTLSRVSTIGNMNPLFCRMLPPATYTAKIRYKYEGQDYWTELNTNKDCKLEVIPKPQEETPLIMGDLNSDSKVDILDLTLLITYLYKGTGDNPILKAVDFDNDGIVSINDVSKELDLILSK